MLMFLLREGLPQGVEETSMWGEWVFPNKGSLGQ
jgi:hypothetical protein